MARTSFTADVSTPPGGPYNVYLDAAGATQTTDLTARRLGAVA